ncbi:STAS domain-containing protein [Tolypothrix sp. PCC 7910]|uniref:STAS domain-containing protein n=1 Tax=Tolypothrix sp. PCC 7910 TaxID=2099387 RepID=UPI0014278DC0|nr:STAS domain-containing protein [Tolypothrix sp. PCC 7910]QIR38125.1 STAS domain-containing protein [Tolypothrix sp. PCC 7910]
MSSAVKIFQPSGIFNGIQGNQLRREVNSAVGDGVEIVLIDLANVTLMDSSGLGALLSLLRIMKESGAKLFICSVSEPVQMLFEMTKMDSVFETFANQDEFNRAILV